MLGVERRQLVGRRFTDFVGRQSQDDFYLAQYRPADARWSSELVLRKANGVEFPASLEMEPGDVGWRCVMTDITMRQAAERAQRESEGLRASEDRYRGLAEQIVDGIIITDAQGRPLDANRAACDLYGYTLDELKALSVEDMFAAVELPQLFDVFQRLAKGESFTTSGASGARMGRCSRARRWAGNCRTAGCSPSFATSPSASA
jgi:PAS domain-containing protein